jgi:signal transduction histidine kinase
MGISAAELTACSSASTDRSGRSRATGGGPGLAIVKHIATNHGGRVEVASRPGEGSTFTLRLPARPRRRAGATRVC